MPGPKPADGTEAGDSEGKTTPAARRHRLAWAVLLVRVFYVPGGADSSNVPESLPNTAVAKPAPSWKNLGAEPSLMLVKTSGCLARAASASDLTLSTRPIWRTSLKTHGSTTRPHAGEHITLQVLHQPLDHPIHVQLRRYGVSGGIPDQFCRIV